MTIKELYETIKQKKDNALNHLKQEAQKPQPRSHLQIELNGEISAYNDVLALIESSEGII